jgi:hypothetical protein
MKTIQANTIVKGEYAMQVLKEAYAIPTESAINRNEKALRLLKKLRGN